MENSMEFPQKIETRTTMWSRNPISGYISRETEITTSKRYQNSQKMEKIKRPSADEWVFFKLVLNACVSFFNWRLITLQYFGGFCHTFTWIHHGYTCVPHPEPSSHLPPYPTPLGHPSAPAVSTLSHASNLDYFTHGNIHVSMLFSQIIPPSSSLTEFKSLFFTSVSLLLSCIQGYH